ncbi:ankyrin repeat-containing domain protein [Lentinula edodes]|nr:ankyrin repeat-containing domain protein [Lentinula edodes]
MGSRNSTSSSNTVTDHSDYQNREIGEWLSPFDFMETQRVILHSRAPNTGLKPLLSEAYVRWRNGDDRTLLMSGLPGAGKSMTAASVVQDLNEYYEGCKVAVVCVFCDFGQMQMQTTDALIASMLRQLIQAHDTVHSTVASMYIHHTSRSTFPRFDEIVASFSTSVQQFESVFVVVDALDECPDDQTRSQLISTLNSFPVSLLFTSRPHPSTDQLLGGCTRQDIIADKHDLWIYCEERFTLSRVGQLCSPDSKQEILNQVVQKAGGMFVVARLLMDALLEAPNVKEALGIILTMPTGLQGTYGKTVQHMCEGTNPEIKDLALYSLLWITFSRRVLVFSELQEAVATLLKPDNPGQCITSDLLTKQSLLDACAGLITIEDRTDKVRLIHYTVHEYLVKEQVNLWTNVQRTMAVTCVSYLRYILPRLQYNSEVYVEEEIRNASIQYPFFGYALFEWGHHVHSCGELKLVNEVLALLASDTHCTLSRMLTFDAMNSPKCTPWSALHFSAHFDLASTCSEIIYQHQKRHKKFLRSLFLSKLRSRGSGSNKDYYLDIQDDYERTPLMIAASRGNFDMVRMLLGHNVDVDARDLHARTPLSYAMGSRSKEVVELLLKQGVQDVNAKDIFGRTLLFDAVDSGSTDLVLLLLHYHDNVRLNAEDHSRRSALSHVAQYGYSDVVKTLLQDEGINVNQRDGKGMVPLLYASMEGHALVTRILCDRKDISINASNDDGRCSLSLAAQRGYESVVKYLLASPEIDVNLADLKLRTALSFGAQHGRTEIVRALLSRKEVAVNRRDILGRSPLSYAADQTTKERKSRNCQHSTFLSNTFPENHSW